MIHKPVVPRPPELSLRHLLSWSGAQEELQAKLYIVDELPRWLAERRSTEYPAAACILTHLEGWLRQLPPQVELLDRHRVFYEDWMPRAVRELPAWVIQGLHNYLTHWHYTLLEERWLKFRIKLGRQVLSLWTQETTSRRLVFRSTTLRQDSWQVQDLDTFLNRSGGVHEEDSEARERMIFDWVARTLARAYLHAMPHQRAVNLYCYEWQPHILHLQLSDSLRCRRITGDIFADINQPFMPHRF